MVQPSYVVEEVKHVLEYGFLSAFSDKESRNIAKVPMLTDITSPSFAQDYRAAETLLHNKVAEYARENQKARNNLTRIFGTHENTTMVG